MRQYSETTAVVASSTVFHGHLLLSVIAWSTYSLYTNIQSELYVFVIQNTFVSQSCYLLQGYRMTVPALNL